MPGRLDTLAVRSDFAFPGAPATLPAGKTPPQLGVTQSKGSVTFTLDSTARWTIDTTRFAGKPKLTVTTGQGPLPSRVTLAGAKLPGTGVPADVVIVLGATGPAGTPADFTFSLGGFAGHVILEDWLAGRAALRSAVSLSGDICPLGASSNVAFTGSGQAAFTPDWRMQIDGPDIATINGLGAPIRADRLTLQLLAATDPSLSRKPRPKRTGLTLTAGTNTWALTPAVTSLPIGSLKTEPGLFDTIMTETGEGKTGGGAARELLATSSSAIGLSLAVRGGFSDENGNPFSLALASPAYAIAFHASSGHSPGDETLLTAHFGMPRWLVVDGFALLLCDRPGPPGFECATLNERVTSLRCEPGLTAAAAPLAGDTGVATTPLLLSGAALPLVTTPGKTPGWGLLTRRKKGCRRRFSLPDFGVSVLRRDDLLALDLRFYNLAFEAGGGEPPELVRRDSHDAHLVVGFNSPQHIAERAYLERVTKKDNPHPVPQTPDPDPQTFDEEPPPAAGDVETRAAGPSRLAFRLPPTTATLSYTLDSLLHWAALEQSVVPVAAQPDPGNSPPAARPELQLPTETHTAIEAPWRLLLSPTASAAWAHSTAPVSLSGRTELWHTRLAVRQWQNGRYIANEAIPRRVRAVWSLDYVDPPGPKQGPPLHADVPFRMSLDSKDRDQIVRLSSGFTMDNYSPVSIPADKLYLSTLGAWIEVFGSWEPDEIPELFSLLQWQHRAALGRDSYVRVVYSGYLLPFGNQAALVKVTERKVQSVADGMPSTAYLRQRFFVVVREPAVSYEDEKRNLTAAQQRNLPYRSVTLTTLVTPNIIPVVIDGMYSFFPTVKDAATNIESKFLFHVVGTDWAGRTSEFSAPLYFVEQGGPDPVAAAKSYTTAVGNYNTSDLPTRRRDLAAQKIAFAEENVPGDTSLRTDALTFAAEPAKPAAGARAPFFPKMTTAEVVVEAVEQLSQHLGPGTGSMAIEYFQPYLDRDAAQWDPGEVFAKLAGTSPKQVTFDGRQSGGVANPNLAVCGLSRKFGTVSGTDPHNVNSGTFNYADIFQDAGAVLFGVVKLADLLDEAYQHDRQVPQLHTLESADGIVTSLAFTPQVKNYQKGPLTLTFANPAGALNLQTQLTVGRHDNAKPRVDVKGELKEFSLSLAGVVEIRVKLIQFSATDGHKLNITAELDDDPIRFIGDLRFLDKLRKAISSTGFTDPPFQDVTAQGITAGYTLAIPSITVGQFSLENIGLGAALTLPFSAPNPLRFRFNFNEPQHPFTVSIAPFGGGGSFSLAVGPDGLESLNASLEFGGNLSANLVVASGNLHVMGGIAIGYEKTGSHLTAYLRAGGSVTVLGFFSVSVEFYIGMEFFPGDLSGAGCKLAGVASLSVEVGAWPLEMSVTIPMSYELGDPAVLFGDMITAGDWNDYCDAFA